VPRDTIAMAEQTRVVYTCTECRWQGFDSRCSRHWSRGFPTACESFGRDHGGAGISLQLMEDLKLEQGNSVRRKELWRGTAMD